MFHGLKKNNVGGIYLWGWDYSGETHGAPFFRHARMEQKTFPTLGVADSSWALPPGRMMLDCQFPSFALSYSGREML